MKYHGKSDHKSEHSRSPHGERGLKSFFVDEVLPGDTCRSPHGERGLKSKAAAVYADGDESLPPRGAWIEIFDGLREAYLEQSRSPHGERGLKCY